ncbi:MAG: response regulator transcription factor [Chloroflexi bacterium]|nr:response regulator transcription factor [Chloroflexota bacterium]
MLATTAPQVRLLVAEPAELIREGICSALMADARYLVGGRVDRLQDALTSWAGAPPDVVIVGLTRSGAASELDATAALRMIFEPWPHALVIALAHRDSVENLIRAVEQGARGALLLDTTAAALRQAVEDVLAGGCVLDPRLTDRMFATVNSTADTAAHTTADSHSGTLRRPLSAREVEVLRELSGGLRNKEIAGRLGISAGTVKTHVASIFEKLQVNDRTAAAVAAIHLHLLDAA